MWRCHRTTSGCPAAGRSRRQARYHSSSAPPIAELESREIETSASPMVENSAADPLAYRSEASWRSATPVRTVRSLPARQPCTCCSSTESSPYSLHARPVARHRHHSTIVERIPFVVGVRHWGTLLLASHSYAVNWLLVLEAGPVDPELVVAHDLPVLVPILILAKRDSGGRHPRHHQRRDPACPDDRKLGPADPDDEPAALRA